MIVHSYCQPVLGMADPNRLLNLWRKNWEEHGFQTRILTEEDARNHPGYDYFVARISRFPSSNPKGYDRACFLRHLAMANINGGLLVDYDVFCREKYQPGNGDHLPSSVVLFEPTRVPCACLGDAQAYEDLCDILCEYQPNNEKHVSDMTIIRKTNLQAESICVEHLNSGRPVVDEPGDGWLKAPMIHFSSFSFSKLGWSGDKADMILRVMATL